MPEKSETPGEEPPRRIDRDLLAERRARRAAAVTEHERELQRLQQREFAEQQLRIEAEDRCIRLERERRAEIERLERRLRASERHTHGLTTHLETVRRELAEAEHALRVMRAGHAAIAMTVDELKGVAARLRAAAAEKRSAEPMPTEREPVASEPPEPHREEMAAALAAAVERLRARAQEPPVQPPPARPIAPVEKPALYTYKHSMSLLTRWRIRRKQRRER
jgi:hypothetical protein